MKNNILKLMALLMGITVVSCAPVRVDPIIEIEPNETAFVIPLEMGTENQEKLESIEFLQQNQVAAKRIIVPQRQRKVGRMWFDVEWIPTVRVITVNREPVTRSWTQEPENRQAGTRNPSTSTLGVESKDSIGFSVGVNVSAYIEESDTAKYLYYYRGNELAKIMDQNVREKVHTVLSQEFASRTLEECKVQKVEIRDALQTQVADHFKKYGITITSIGLAEGLFFEQEEIQDAINAAYVAEMEVKREAQKTAAQTEINNRLLAQARGERAQAEEFAAAAEERKKLVDLEIQKMKAEALLEIAKKWDGKMPHFLSAGGAESMLMQIPTNY
jgi:hypothetical protein